MRFVGPLVQTIGDLGTTVRGLARTREVATILVRHGFGAFVPEIPGVSKPDDAAVGTPERFVAALADLGPTWVKLGQVLSTRPDLLPEGLYTLLTLSSLLERLPLSAAQLLDDLDAQRLQLGIQLQGDPLDREQADRRTGRTIAGGIAGSLVLAGAIVQVGAQTVVWTGVILRAVAIPLALAGLFGWTPRGRMPS